MRAALRHTALRRACLVVVLLAGTTAAALAGTPRPSPAPGAGPPHGNSAWVYDALYRNGHVHGSQPGSFVDAINRYNRGAAPQHAITRVYTYGGSLEMYCHRGPEHCAPDDLKFAFGSAGQRSAAAYATRLEPIAGQRVKVETIIDGSLRAHYNGSLRGFNHLSPALARGFADKVAGAICADPQVSGVQFDLEPFNVASKNGQYWFYRRIAEDFAGAGSQGAALHCADAQHPQGRDFSIFGAAHDLDPHSARGRNLRDILTAQHNGFFIVALYDLSDQPGGHLSTPQAYAHKAAHQAQMAASDAAALGVPYQLAVPASASAHEYARCGGLLCRQPGDGSQLAYLQAAMQAVDDSGARKDPRYLGTAVWAWSREITHGSMRFSPSTPPAGVLQFLHEHL
ncbi:MAG TPA: hypothetical protein VFQ88_13265 [Nevskiaceae bacterium]|nr:hypothetical protein [Nevskiaceae bacterium]